MVPFIDLRRQYHRIGKEILRATRRVYENGRFVLGEEVARFEEEFARYCGVRHAVSVASGTDALYLSLKAAGIGEGDEVITSSLSFISSALAVSFTGAIPVFTEIDPGTYTLDPNGLEVFLKRRMAKKGRRRVKAILPVHLYGHPADMDPIQEIAKRYDLPVIEDACQAHGAAWGRKKAGAFGAFGCFSFYPTKNLGAYGDGGIVVTNHQKFYERLRLLRCYGEKRKYHHTLKGGNSRLDELQAAILRVKLRHLDLWNEERRKRAESYTEKLAPMGVACPVEREGARHVYHLYVIRTERRDALKAFLKERGIETLIHYPVPIHRQEAYRELGYRKGDLPLTEAYSRTILSLPIFPEMNRAEMDEVVKSIQDFMDRGASPTRKPVRRQGRKAGERGASD